MRRAVRGNRPSPSSSRTRTRPIDPVPKPVSHDIRVFRYSDDQRFERASFPNERTHQWNFSDRAADLRHGRGHRLRRNSRAEHSVHRRSEFAAAQHACRSAPRAALIPDSTPPTLMQTGGSSTYHGLTMQADRRMSAGLVVQRELHWPRRSPTLTCAPTPPGFSRISTRATSNAPTIRISAGINSASATCSTFPSAEASEFGSDMPAAWTSSSAAGNSPESRQCYTGARLSPAYSNADPANTNQFGGRPDRIGDGNLDSGEMRDLIRAGSRSSIEARSSCRRQDAASTAIGAEHPHRSGQAIWNTGLHKNWRARRRAADAVPLGDVQRVQPGELQQPDHEHSERRLRPGDHCRRRPLDAVRTSAGFLMLCVACLASLERYRGALVRPVERRRLTAGADRAAHRRRNGTSFRKNLELAGALSPTISSAASTAWRTGSGGGRRSRKPISRHRSDSIRCRARTPLNARDHRRIRAAGLSGREHRLRKHARAVCHRQSLSSRTTEPEQIAADHLCVRAFARPDGAKVELPASRHLVRQERISSRSFWTRSSSARSPAFITASTIWRCGTGCRSATRPRRRGLERDSRARLSGDAQRSGHISKSA